MKLHLMRVSVALATMMLVLTCGAEGFSPTPCFTTTSTPFSRGTMILPPTSIGMVMRNPSDPRMLPNNTVGTDASALKGIHENSIPQVSQPMPVGMMLPRTIHDDLVLQHIIQILAALLAMALLFMPLSSEAAMSGGRIGGSFSPSYQSRSSWTSPSRSSYSPSSYSGSANKSSYSSSSYLRGYSSTPGYSSTFTTHGIGFAYHPLGSPFSPFGFGCPSNPSISPLSPFCDYLKHN